MGLKSRSSFPILFCFHITNMAHTINTNVFRFVFVYFFFIVVFRFIVVWVDTGKTLREQGIDESETVLLKRKFFFSDQNIDSRDPVQLNLLYVQARDAILDGTHPVTQEKGMCIENENHLLFLLNYFSHTFLFYVLKNQCCHQCLIVFRTFLLYS